MERIPEPMLMLDAAQVEAFATADFAETNASYVKLFRRMFPDAPPSALVLDACCGPGDITLRFARVFEGWRIHGVDGSAPMLEHARRASAQAKLEDRVFFMEAQLPCAALGDCYDVILCTGSLHHFPEPQAFWSTVRERAGHGAFVFVTDFRRPASAADAEALVRRHALGAPEVLQRDYYNSLRAAFTPAELEAQLAAADLLDLEVSPLGDRHVLVCGRAGM